MDVVQPPLELKGIVVGLSKAEALMTDWRIYEFAHRRVDIGPGHLTTRALSLAGAEP